MRHLAAYLMLVVGGNSAPTAADVTAMLGKAGIDVDQASLTTLISELEGKDLAELLKIGEDKLCTLSSGGGGGAPVAAAAGGGGAAAAADAPKAAAKPKEEEVDPMEGGMDMFGGGGGGGDY